MFLTFPYPFPYPYTDFSRAVYVNLHVNVNGESIAIGKGDEYVSSEYPVFPTSPHPPAFLY